MIAQAFQIPLRPAFPRTLQGSKSLSITQSSVTRTSPTSKTHFSTSQSHSARNKGGAKPDRRISPSTSTLSTRFPLLGRPILTYPLPSINTVSSLPPNNPNPPAPPLFPQSTPSALDNPPCLVPVHPRPQILPPIRTRAPIQRHARRQRGVTRWSR
jgi:hypothetical protein